MRLGKLKILIMCERVVKVIRFDKKEEVEDVMDFKFILFLRIMKSEVN